MLIDTLTPIVSRLLLPPSTTTMTKLNTSTFFPLLHLTIIIFVLPFPSHAPQPCVSSCLFSDAAQRAGQRTLQGGGPKLSPCGSLALLDSLVWDVNCSTRCSMLSGGKVHVF
jgi:hypothetical protein